MALENTKASPGFDVPKSDGVVRRPADDQIVVVLQAGDPAFVTVQGSDELAGT